MIDKTWIKLNYADLPNDILTGKYEFAWTDSFGVHEYENQKDIDDRLNILGHAEAAGNVCYRTKMPTPPTHEEIMTKWWKVNDKPTWVEISLYQKGFYYIVDSRAVGSHDAKLQRVDKTWFIGRESADIPPEK